MQKLAIVMSNELNFLAKLSEDCQGFARPAIVKRRTDDDNVAWFQFVLDTKEDGRLVPKDQEYDGLELKLSVCHIWQVDSFIETIYADGGYRCTIRLPRRPPKPPEKVFAIIVEIDHLEQQRTLLSSYNQPNCEELRLSSTAATESAPFWGSPQFYKVINVFDIRQVIGGQDSVVQIREVLGDVHLFRQSQSALSAEQLDDANNATDWPTKLLSQVIEYSDGGKVGILN